MLDAETVIVQHALDDRQIFIFDLQELQTGFMEVGVVVRAIPYYFGVKLQMILVRESIR